VAAYLYKEACKVEWKCPISHMGVGFLQEIMFHSIWGTFGTDFGLLEHITI